MSDDPTKLTSFVPTIGFMVEHVLADLSSKVPDLLVFGPEDDAANAPPNSIYWQPVSEQYSAPQRQGKPSAPGHLYVRKVPVEFFVFGGLAPEGAYTDAQSVFHNCDLSEAIVSRLLNALHRSLSNQSYQVLGAEWFNSGRTGVGMSCQVTVEFMLPIVREDNPTVTPTAGPFNPTVEFVK